MLQRLPEVLAAPRLVIDSLMSRLRRFQRIGFYDTDIKADRAVKPPRAKNDTF